MKLGKVSENVLKRSVLRQINTRREEVLSGAGVGEDCAIFSFLDGEMVTCVQEGIVAATEEQIVELADTEPVMTMAQLVQKCANNLAVYQAAPVGIMIALLLPETTEEAQIKALMAQAEEKCKELSMEIVGGQTNVLKAVTMPVAAVTGIGKIAAGTKKEKKAEPGQDVVISKWIGLEGTALLAKRYRAKLLERYPAYLVEEAAGFDRYLSILPEAATAVKSGVCVMHDASEGGIFASLWELAEKAGVGLTIDMKKIPLRQETVEVCECCGLNPYELMSGGCLVMTTRDGSGLVAALEAQGIPAVVAGKVTDGNDRILVNGDEIRYMEKPKQDEVYK